MTLQMRREFRVIWILVAAKLRILKRSKNRNKLHRMLKERLTSNGTIWEVT